MVSEQNSILDKLWPVLASQINKNTTIVIFLMSFLKNLMHYAILIYPLVKVISHTIHYLAFLLLHNITSHASSHDYQ